jgi:hypothetical protein
MPESKTNDFVWDGSQKNFAIFEDKAFERFVGMETVEESHNRQWYMNSDASITEHNLEEFGNKIPLSILRRLRRLGIPRLLDGGGGSDGSWLLPQKGGGVVA